MFNKGFPFHLRSPKPSQYAIRGDSKGKGDTISSIQGGYTVSGVLDTALVFACDNFSPGR